MLAQAIVTASRKKPTAPNTFRLRAPISALRGNSGWIDGGHCSPERPRKEVAKMGIKTFLTCGWRLDRQDGFFRSVRMMGPALFAQFVQKEFCRETCFVLKQFEQRIF